MSDDLIFGNTPQPVRNHIARLETRVKELELMLTSTTLDRDDFEADRDRALSANEKNKTYVLELEADRDRLREENERNAAEADRLAKLLADEVAAPNARVKELEATLDMLRVYHEQHDVRHARWEAHIRKYYRLVAQSADRALEGREQ